MVESKVVVVVVEGKEMGIVIYTLTVLESFFSLPGYRFIYFYVYVYLYL